MASVNRGKQFSPLADIKITDPNGDTVFRVKNMDIDIAVKKLNQYMENGR